MSSVLSSFFARDPRAAFSYELPATAQGNLQGINYAASFKKAEPSETATCFWTSLEASSLRAQIHKLKTMRHPSVLTYLDSIEADNNVYLITEPCRPLRDYIRDTQFTGAQKEFVSSWGIFQIMSGLKFLHEANLSHGDLRPAIYVTTAGDWKIGGLQHASAFTSARPDLNALALVIWEVFEGFNESLQKPLPPSQSKQIPKRLHALYTKLAGPQAGKVSVEELLQENRRAGGFFKNSFVDTLLFLEEFQLKEASEKQRFFTQLREHLDAFPDDVAKYKILPKLILTYEYGDAGPNILIPLFRLGRLLDEQEYQRRIVPCLVKLFLSPDRTTRVKLLEKIDEFAPHLTTAVVNDKIYSNLATGFMDASPAVREVTVKAMVALADKLNNNNLNNDLMKHLARLQGADDQGGIRTNTTICLGKIGYLLDPAQRQRILLSAFTRALKDPFPPARMAALLALAATQQFYTLVEIANRVVPAISPLLCDPEKQVRDQAFKATKGFVEKLEKASENPELIAELEAQVKAGRSSGLLDSDKVPQWASWALKSLSGKFYKGTPPPEGAPAAAAGGKESNSQPTQNASSRNTTPVPQRLHKPSTPTPTASSDGWGDLDDEDDEAEFEDAPAPPPAPKSFAPSKASTTSGGWEAAEDEDDWSNDWEKPKEEKPKPTPKVASSTIRPKPVVSSSGALKLASKPKPVQKEEDDLDYLLGATTMPRVQPKPAAPAPVAAKTSTGGGGWDDFGGDDEKPVASSGGGGWEDDGWGESEKPAAPAAQSKEARRAEMAARNEARRKELAAKRATRGGGALRLTKQNE